MPAQRPPRQHLEGRRCVPGRGVLEEGAKRGLGQ